MKGIILDRCPEAGIVDLCHEVGPFDILGASFLLQSAVGSFPEGAIHLAVVDPGVGTERRPILAEIDGRLFVAPDNGILAYPMASGRRLCRPGTYGDGVLASSGERLVSRPGYLCSGGGSSRRRSLPGAVWADRSRPGAPGDSLPDDGRFGGCPGTSDVDRPFWKLRHEYRPIRHRGVGVPRHRADPRSGGRATIRAPGVLLCRSGDRRMRGDCRQRGLCGAFLQPGEFLSSVAGEGRGPHRSDHRRVGVRFVMWMQCVVG